MTEIVNLNILECNRLNSEEAKSGNNENNALWHNKLGTGINIQPGDRISVEQSFVSEDGAGDAVIEFNGDELNGSASITYTSITKTNACSSIPQGYERKQYENDSHNISQHDNKCSIVINYYKSMNGENYVQMPRKFVCKDSILNSASETERRYLWYAQERSVNSGSNTSYTSSAGLPFHQVPYFDRNSRVYFYCDADYYYFPGDIRSSNGDNEGMDFFKLRNDGSKYTIFSKKDNYFLANPGQSSVLNDTTSQVNVSLSLASPFILPEVGWYISNDPTRYITAITASGVATFNGSVSYDKDDTISWLRHPAEVQAPASTWPKTPSEFEYVEFKKKIDIEVDKGFNSPSNIASEITNILRSTGSLDKINYDRFLNTPNFTPEKPFSAFVESETYNIFDAMNCFDMTDLAYDKFNASHSDTTQPTQTTLDYVNAFQHIGIKRPDLYTYGRIVSESLLSSQSSVELRGSFTDASLYIETTMLWNSINLNLLRELFIIQGRYPELFEQKYNEYGDGSRGPNLSISVDNNRFLHINPFLRVGGPSASITSPFLSRLGNDDTNGSGSFFPSWEYNYISLPIYFFFDKSRADILDGGESPSTLWGGFAYRNPGSGSTPDTISLYVGAKGSGYHPPVQYIQNNNSTGTGLQMGTLLGWDTHWTAFSTCVIALIDGWTETPFVGAAPSFENLWGLGLNATWNDASAITQSPADIATQAKKIYMGSNEPLLNFNTVDSRFEWQQLHTPEYIGNDSRAGSTPSASTTISIPVNPDANTKVYKINKRFTQHNWTTALLPYTSNFVVSASGAVAYNLALLNYNVDAWTILDSHTGIQIIDFGYTKENWNDGLWGILGFSYEQFNTSYSSTMNPTSRITEINRNALAAATTNADVNAGQAINFNTNAWGAGMFNMQIPMTYYWNGSGNNASASQQADGTRKNFVIQNYPPISEEQTSVAITAKNLPRKMLKPYYCIRSDLIDKAEYIGGPDSGQSLPVIGIVNKINGYGDFYFSDDSKLVFTATKAKTVTSITTSIHYPDQTYALVNNNSAVIYRIEKNRLNDNNILNEIIQEQQSKSKS